MKLYRVLRVILRQALELYFVDIQSTGREKIPEDGPVIFAANHPNSIMDTVILGTQTRREIRYMARSGLFGTPIAATIFNYCGVIPIYRSQDNESETDRNQESFRAAYEVLRDGGCIGIFPEGQNSPDRHVREIKTGTARIALGAASQYDYQLDLNIVPVGLNFEDRDRFLSGVLIRFGDPISIRDYTHLHIDNPDQAIRELTERIQDDIRELALHIEDNRNHELVHDIHAIYGRELINVLIGDLNMDERSMRQRLIDELRVLTGPKADLDDRFTVEQYIADAVDYYHNHHPTILAQLRMDIQRYKDHLDQVRLHHDFADRPPQTLSLRKESVKLTAYALAFGLVALWGFINSFIPYFITRHITLRAPDEATRAITLFVAGALAFPLFYTLQGWALWHMTEYSWPSVLVYLLSLPVTGFFFLSYRRQITRYRNRILSRTLFRSEEDLVLKLFREREHLLQTFEKLRDQYMIARMKDSVLGSAHSSNTPDTSPEPPQPSP